MFDTHCHLTSPQLASRVEEVLAEAAAAGVRGAITVGTTAADSQAALALARRFQSVWCSAGVHPLHSDEPIEWETLGEIIADPRCVAWGELGLDHHYEHPPRALQRRVLEQQLALIQSVEISKRQNVESETIRAIAGQAPLDVSTFRRSDVSSRPIIVHCRDAFDDLLAIFRSTALTPQRFVFHCFTGGPDEARKVLDFGAWISFTGVVTFANAKEVVEAARIVPLDRMMVETDAPFLTPEPVRKVRPNEPKFVVHVARRLAEIRGIEPEELERQLDSNAERCFGVHAHIPSPTALGGPGQGQGGDTTSGL